MSWYLPPELGACDREVLDATFPPAAGHAVNIVGYSVAGSLTHPDPYNSYFIIENNWGKTAGYHSFFFMNFAAFKYLAHGLQTYRLDAACWSNLRVASAGLYSIHGPRPFRVSPRSSRSAVPALPGSASPIHAVPERRTDVSGKPPVIPGIVSNYQQNINNIGQQPH